MATKKRKTTSAKTEIHVLARSRHRCALCFGLCADSAVKQGQVAHIDRNPANLAFNNLVFLCLPHHDQYDSTTSQSKNFGAGEVRQYRGELDVHLRSEKIAPWAAFRRTAGPSRPSKSPVPLSSPEVYDRRIAIYRAFRKLVLSALRDAEVSLQELGNFAEATDEALFLLGPDVSEYLREVYSKGVRLYYTSGRIRNERLDPKEDYSGVVRENAEVLNWFSQHLDAGRGVFANALLLGCPALTADGTSIIS